MVSMPCRVAIKFTIRCQCPQEFVWINFYDAGLPALYMCVTVPLGFLLNGEWHYGSEEMLVP